MFLFFFFFRKEEEEEERQMRRMQRNGLIGQEFVCVKTERWCIGKKTHTQAHAHMHTLKVCSSGSVLLRGTGQPDPESFASRQGIIGFYF